MTKNQFATIVIFIMLIACKENTSDKTGAISDSKLEKGLSEQVLYYERNPNQIFKRTVAKTEFDSVYFYYDNGVLFKNGKKTKTGKKFGIWNLYDRNGILREIREWFVIKGSEKANRAWFLNEKMDTIAWRTQDSIFKQKEFINDTINFRNTVWDQFIFNKDTISLSEPIRGIAFCNSKSIQNEETAKIKVVIALHDSINFNSDFSNEEQIKTVTFNCLSIDTKNQKYFTDSDLNYTAVFGLRFDSPGEKILRGYMQEYSYGPFKDKTIDSIIGLKRYFEKRVYVKDTMGENTAYNRSNRCTSP